jgi:phage terminase large subunit GpA-like protein
MSLASIQQALNAFTQAVAPPPDLRVSDWARHNFRLSSEYSASVGEFVPHAYQIEPLDVLGPSNPSDMMVMMCAAQMMKTLIMLVFLGYVIDVDPGPVLIAQPSEADADSFSKERIAPMVRDVPVLAAKVEEQRGRDSGNTILQKRFRGGQVSLTGAISPRGLRRRSVRYLLLDEIDGYEDTAEGDPVDLAVMRTVTFWNRKIVLCSTPTIHGNSRIERAFEDSDQRRYFMPCPWCEHEQVLVWGRVKWGVVDGEVIEPANAHYQCEKCERLIPHHLKLDMLQKGRWVATNAAGRYPGFGISRLYAMDWSWGRIVTEKFLPAKDNPIKLQSFVNTILAETWKSPGESAPDWEKLSSRIEDYRLGTVPLGVLFLTAGVDVQKSWIEGYVWGWGRGQQRWLVDHFRFEGDPYGSEVWKALEEQLARTYRHPCGVDLPIARMAVDSGYATNEVYLFVRRQGIGRAIAVDGRPRGMALVGSPQPVDITVQGRKLTKGVKIWPVNVSTAKSELYGYLNKERPKEGEPYPSGWVHFATGLDEEFFRQLTAEHLQTRVVKGYPKYEWIKTRERNEALDCANYARGAANVCGMDRFQEQHWAALESGLKANDQGSLFDAPIAPAPVVVQARTNEQPETPAAPQPARVPVPQAPRPKLQIRLV